MRLIVKAGDNSSWGCNLKITRGNKIGEVDVYEDAFMLFSEEGKFPKGAIVSDKPFKGAQRLPIKGDYDDTKNIAGADFCVDGLIEMGLPTKGYLYVKGIKR